MSRPDLDHVATRPSNADALYEYVQAAASLRLEMASFEEDRRRIDAGHKIVYCVDTNIVNLYLQPERMGPRKSKGGGRFGVVFPGDPEDLSTALAAALSRFIFFDLEGGKERSSLPLVLLLGHDAEVRTTYEILSKSYEMDLDEIAERRRTLRTLIDEMVSRKNESATYEDKIFDLLYGSTLTAERFNRINRLISGQRIGRLASLTDRIAQKLATDVIPAKDIKQALSVPLTIHDQIEESARRNWWRKRLTMAAPQRAPIRLHVDSCALARLEVVNRRLLPLNATLVLITGDEAMHAAGSNYKVDVTKGQDFAFAYLRHPRAFLASTNILARTEADGARSLGQTTFTSDWLEPLLSEYMTLEGPKLSGLKRFIHRSSRDDIPQSIRDVAVRYPGTVDVLAKQWLGHADLVRRQHSTSSELARGEIRRVLGAATMDQIQPALERLDDELVAQSEATWQSFFTAIAHAGFDIALGNVRRPNSRLKSAPNVMFDSFPATSRFVQRALSLKPDYDLREDLEHSLEEIEREDPLHYAKLLAYSVLFASDGTWYVAKVLALRAIEISKWVRKERDRRSSVGSAEDASWFEQAGKISGREAYFCAAVATRNTARSITDLDLSERYVDRASELLVVDRERHEPTSVTALRFEAERKALELTRVLFGVFCRLNGAVGPFVGKLGELLTDLRRIWCDTSSMRDEFARDNMVRTTLTNLFMCLALYEEGVSSSRDPTTPADDLMREVASCVRPYLQNVEDRDHRQVYVTQLVRAISLYVRSRFKSMLGLGARDLKGAIDKLEAEWLRSMEEHIAMPYDEARFTFLIRVSRENLTKP